jgi:hypothetical protein
MLGWLLVDPARKHQLNYQRGSLRPYAQDSGTVDMKKKEGGVKHSLLSYTKQIKVPVQCIMQLSALSLWLFSHACTQSCQQHPTTMYGWIMDAHTNSTEESPMHAWMDGYRSTELLRSNWRRNPQLYGGRAHHQWRRYRCIAAGASMWPAAGVCCNGRRGCRWMDHHSCEAITMAVWQMHSSPVRCFSQKGRGHSLVPSLSTSPKASISCIWLLLPPLEHPSACLVHKWVHTHSRSMLLVETRRLNALLGMLCIYLWSRVKTGRVQHIQCTMLLISFFLSFGRINCTANCHDSFANTNSKLYTSYVMFPFLLDHHHRSPCELWTCDDGI